MFKNRYYQDDCIAAIFAYFESGKTGNPICALPTGTGKSVIIASLIKQVLQAWPNQRVMMLTHVKELIEQNASKMLSIWPDAPIGIYSAGLKGRDIAMPIIFGGVQSVTKAIQRAKATMQNDYVGRHFGHRDLVIIDECHLLSPTETSSYQQIISDLKAINPHLKVIGFSATPYRLKQGSLTEGDDAIFTDTCFDITGVAAFNKLIVEGYICPLIPKATATQIDLESVGIVAGEYNKKELALAVDVDTITRSAINEMIEHGRDRKSWLIFASSVENSDHIAAMLNERGINAASVHSKKLDSDNDDLIQEFKAGKFQALVNNNKLTTGFDHPAIDLIGMLRPTMSAGLWVQMLGRGTRPSLKTGKQNCLVLDFAANTKRLGPINDPVKPSAKGKGKAGEAPVRICPECGVYNHASARTCYVCGIAFTFQSKLFKTASTNELIKNDLPVIEFHDVQMVTRKLHVKQGSPDSIKVGYVCGLKSFSEWVCFEHKG